MKKSAQDVALDFLSHKEHTVKEVKKHLQEKDFGPEEIQTALNMLLEFHYVDDQRYCEAYVRYAMEKGRGPLRIRQELAEKGVDPGLVQLALEDAFESGTELALAMREARKALGLSSEVRESPEPMESCQEPLESQPTEKELARIARRLSSKGFRSSIVCDAVRRLKAGE